LSVIRQIWEQYEKEALPADAGPIQRKESKRVFYAGAATMFNLLMQVEEYSATPADGVIGMRALWADMDEFTKGVKGGLN
jgi:hypothetical protein